MVSAALGGPLKAETVCGWTAGLSFREHGTVMAPPPGDFGGRVGWVIVDGIHADQVRERLAEAEHLLTVKGPYV